MSIAVMTYIIIPPSRHQLYPEFNSYRIYDRRGELLQEVLSRDYTTSVWRPVSKISPYLITCTVFREDKRFFNHPGIDLIAMVRAITQNLKHRSITSGGSTITMQVAKFALNIKNRGFIAKIKEILFALKLEFHLNKSEILEIYLNRAPYGNMNYGSESASRFYFDKKCDAISWGEAALLSCLPQAPALFDPCLHPERLNTAKEKLLEQLYKLGLLNRIAYEIALLQQVRSPSGQTLFKAPHFTAFIEGEIDRLNIKKPSVILTTLDYDLQSYIEQVARTSLKSLRDYNVNQVSVVVLDRMTGDILAMVGSRDYCDAREGQVNGCISLRQPGSSIKPFLYSLALDAGIPLSALLPDTLWEFRLTDGTWFAPRNYGDVYHGPTRVREALGNSFNVPTVYILERITVPRFFGALQQIGFDHLDRDASHYGLSLGLGAGEVTLLELVNAYRGLSMGGVFGRYRSILSFRGARTGPEQTRAAIDPGSEHRVFSKEACYVVTDILSDNASRIKAFGDDSPMNLPFPCAVKTGTSKDYRDNWCAGYTTAYVVGVWVGNFDGSPMQGISGVTGAAPLFRDVMIELHRSTLPERFPPPPNLERTTICGRSGLLASSDCPVRLDEIFLAGTEPIIHCSACGLNAGPSAYFRSAANHPDSCRPFIIVHPREGDIFKIDPQVTRRQQQITIRIDAIGDLGPLEVRLNDMTLGRADFPYILRWPAVPGQHTLEVFGHGRSERISFRVF